MSCSIDQDVRIITKYSTISGVEPTIPLSADHNDGTWLPTDLYVGEIFLNSADDLVWIRTDNGIAPLSGSFSATYSFTGDFVPVSGGTFSGCVYIPCLTVGSASITELYTDSITGGLISGTFTGDGSGLTGITTTWDGGTVSNPVYFTNTVDFTNTINLNGPVVGNLDLTGDVEISGGVSASIFYGDGSGLTNLPTGTYSDIYTTAASLSGNNIVFDRNDSLQYSVDLTPILGTQGVATIDWNSATNQLDLTLLNGEVVSTTIDGFDTLTALTSVTAPEFYGGTYYGSFVGTFSGVIENDIYSTTASLVGTELIIQRNDGITFSADLSSLSDAPTLEEVLINGNVAGTNWIEFPKPYGLKSTSTSFNDNITFNGGSIRITSETAIADQTSFLSISHSGVNLTADGTIYINANSNFIIDGSGNPTFSGVEYFADYSTNYTKRSLVDKEYVDGLIVVPPSLSEVLNVGNTTGTNWVDISESGTGYGLYSGTYGTDFNQINFRNDRLLLYSWNGVDGKSQVTLWRDGNVDIQGGDALSLDGTNGIVLNSSYGNIQLSSLSAITVNSTSPTFSGIEYTTDYSTNYTNRSLVDKEYVDGKVVGAGVFVTGSGTNAIKNLGDGSNVSSGSYAFAMGQNNIANGSFGNAFGFGNTASGNYSTLIGRNNTSTLGYTYIMGDGNTGGAYSLTVGATNINTGSYNIVTGLSNNNSANYNGIFGRQNTASDSYGFAAGYLNTVGKSYVFGYNNIVAAPNIYNFAAGTNNTITSNYSATIGYNNTVSTNSYGMAFGNGNGVSGLASIAGGQGNNVTTSYSYAFGRNNTVSINSYGGALGYGNSVAWTAHVIGYSNTINSATNSNHSMIAGGFNNNIIGTHNFIATGTVNNINASYAAIIAGLNNTVNGANAVILAGQLNTVTNQEGSILGGNNNTVSANRSSIIGGRQNVVSQPDGAILGGIYNTVSGANSTIIGGTGSSVSGVNSAIIGGTGLTLDGDNKVLVPYLVSDTIVEVGIQLKTPTNIELIGATTSFTFDCNVGTSQFIDFDSATGNITLSITNPIEGNTYTMVVVQTIGVYDLTLPTGWWLNDTAPFDFTTLANDERAIITMTYLNSEWYFAVKKLQLV